MPAAAGGAGWLWRHHAIHIPCVWTWRENKQLQRGESPVDGNLIGMKSLRRQQIGRKSQVKISIYRKNIIINLPNHNAKDSSISLFQPVDIYQIINLIYLK
jgi:hypothetical protein